MKTKLILLTAFFSLMIGCTSDDGPIEMPVNVYIAGTSYTEPNTPTATLLKNGVEQNLADALKQLNVSFEAKSEQSLVILKHF